MKTRQSRMPALREVIALALSDQSGYTIGCIFSVVGKCTGFLCAVGMSLVPVRGQPAETCAQPPAGLAAWWAADGDFDDLAGGSAGTALGDVSFEDGRVGPALAVHGRSEGVRIAASAALDIGAADGLTVEAWINPQSVSIRGPVVEWN